MPSLDGAYLKLTRAKRHIEELRLAIQAYFDLTPYQIIKQENSSGDLVYSLEITQPIPPELGAIVGDTIHNLRSALDLLAWQIVIAGGGKPGKNTSFPITQAQVNFKAIAHSCLKGASKKSIKYIRRLKPWIGGNKTLIQLHTLDIVDKHQVILIVGSAHKNIVLTFQMQVPWLDDIIKSPPIGLRPADRQFPLKNGAELYRINASARSGLMHDEPQFTFEACFGEEGNIEGLPLIPTLENILNHVTRIIQITDKFLI